MPAGRYTGHIKSTNVPGVGAFSHTQSHLAGNGENMEDGEEPTFTLAEEVKHQLHREERRARKAEELKLARNNVGLFPLQCSLFSSHC
jgi:U1 small nuclear ribonucleoprotein